MNDLFPNPVETQNADGDFPFVLMVEHARHFIPPALDNLGVAQSDVETHIGWDIGIEAVTRGVSDALDAPAVYCLYSRLVIDVNRPLENAELIRGHSDGIGIPRNIGLTEADRTARIDGIFHPYHAAGAALVEAVSARHGGKTVIIGMHSCTPQLKDGGAWRPWEIGLSTYESEGEMERLAQLLEGEGLSVGRHTPYDIRDLPGASLDMHGRARGLPHLLIEVRQDLIADEAGCARWAEILARVFARFATI